MSRTKGKRQPPRPKADLKVVDGGADKKPVQDGPAYLICHAWDSEFLKLCLAKLMTKNVLLLRWNRRAERPEWKIRTKEGPLVDSGWAPMDIFVEEKIFDMMKTGIKIKMADDPDEKIKPCLWGGPKQQKRITALRSYFMNHSADPWVDKLEGLPAWDGDERVEWLAENVGWELPYDPSDSSTFAMRDYICKAISIPIVAAVARSYHPGLKFETMTLLQGPQGCGKGTFWEELFEPEERAEWFGTYFPLNGNSKEQIEATLGKVIVEASELVGRRKGDQDKFKAYMSRTNDNGIRLAYDARPESRPRTHVLVGTSNEAHALPNDPSGNRRWLPIPIKSGNAHKVRKYLSENREQIWAEAVALWKAGDFRLWLEPGEFPAHQELLAEGRDRNDTLEDFLDEWLPSSGGQVKVIEIQEALIERGHNKMWDRHITNELKRRDWTLKRTGRGNFWAEPDPF